MVEVVIVDGSDNDTKNLIKKNLVTKILSIIKKINP